MISFNKMIKSVNSKRTKKLNKYFPLYVFNILVTTIRSF